ncbi:MAG: C39 family peptidase [Clostridiaceae bacterium]|nr:C39 family peptidase [Clostridiaceae bacterium]
MNKPTYYSQVDPRWKAIPYTIDGDAIETIGYSGCGPTCAAMIVATWCDPKITPVEMAAYAIATGTRTADNGTDWGFYGKVANKYSLKYKQTYYNAEALERVNSGGVVICSMGPGRWTKSGHYVLWYGVEGNNVLVNDPISTAAKRSKAPISDMYAQSKQYFCFWEDAMTQAQFDEMMDSYLAERSKLTMSSFAEPHIAKAKAEGISDGSSPRSFATREEVITMLMRSKG